MMSEFDLFDLDVKPIRVHTIFLAICMYISILAY